MLPSVWWPTSLCCPLFGGQRCELLSLTPRPAAVFAIGARCAAPAAIPLRRRRAAGRGVSDSSSQRSVGLLCLLRLPLGDPLRDGAALQKPACLHFEPCVRTVCALATCRDIHRSAF